MLAPYKPDRPLTVDEFLSLYTGREERWELVEGEPVMMAGASFRHERVVANLIRQLGNALDGGPCCALPSGMGLQITDRTYRLPDVGIYCDPRDIGPGHGDPNRLRYPKVLFEVWSPSNDAVEHGFKMEDYQSLPSLDTYVTIRADRKTFTTYERVAEREWRGLLHLPGQSLTLRDPAVTLSAEQIFAGLD